MDSATKPAVLMVYFSYTHQTEKVMEAMAEVLRDRGCETTLARIEFTDPRYEKRFKQFPMPKPFLEVVAMIPAELRHRPAQIGIPDVVTEREYDFVFIGSPTWWLSTDIPIRSFLESDGIHFRYQGGQVRSLFSLLSFLGSGEYKERYHGVKIPPTNLQDYHLDEAREFASALGNRLVPASSSE